TMQAPLGPTSLTGKHIRLVPLRLEHLPALLEAGGDEGVSRYLPHRLDDPAAMRARVEAALEAQAAGREFPFVVVARESQRIAGCTSYLDVSEPHRSLEIGWTWYSRGVWGTAVNPEAKF